MVSGFERHLKKRSYLAKFKVDFGQVSKVQTINKSHEDRSEALICTHISTDTKNSRIWETLNLLTDADNRTDTDTDTDLIFTESALRPIQSISRDVRLSVCLSVCLSVGHTLETTLPEG